jgi:hypothetical protein
MFTNARHSRQKGADFSTPRGPGNFCRPLLKKNVRIDTHHTRKLFEINTSTTGSHSSCTTPQDFAVRASISS